MILARRTCRRASCNGGERRVGALLCLLPALGLVACGDNNAYVPPPPPKVSVARPVQQPVTRYIEATGNTQAINTVDLEARVEGFLEQINYQDGGLVKKGTLLFVIQRNTYIAQLDQATANLESGEASKKNAQIQYQRQATLAKDQSPSYSQARADDAKAKLDETVAQVDAAKASLEMAKINLGYTEVKAPFDGIVTRHLADVGALVGSGGPTKLATIVQVDPIYTYFTLSETVVLRVKAELAKRGKTLAGLHEVPVEIGLQTEEGYPHKGHVDYVAPQVDPATGTLEVRAIFDNKRLDLLPGLFVRVRIPVQQIDNALLVADSALRASQAGEYLLVIGKDNTVEQRQVKTGQLDGQMRVIESGLGADDWVVTQGLQRAIPGSKVEPEQKAMVASKGTIR